MKIRLPREIETGSYATVVLDDGRRVNLFDDGTVSVCARDGGGDDYTLTLPSVAWVARHCDAPAGAIGNGRVMIQVVHRH
jgi:hypothetical protein